MENSLTSCNDCAVLTPPHKCWRHREDEEEHYDPDWTGFCIKCGREHEIWSKEMCIDDEARYI